MKMGKYSERVQLLHLCQIHSSEAGGILSVEQPHCVPIHVVQAGGFGHAVICHHALYECEMFAQQAGVKEHKQMGSKWCIL